MTLLIRLFCGGREDKRRWDDIVVSLGSTSHTDDEWDDIDESLGWIPDTGHEWDDDPAAWVRAQRRTDPRRSG